MQLGVLPTLNDFCAVLLCATLLPIGITRCLHGKDAEADTSVVAARKEAETVIFGIVEEALAHSGTKPKEIDIIIVNCSMFSPTPSLCSMVNELNSVFVLCCITYVLFSSYNLIPLAKHNLGYSSLWNEERYIELQSERNGLQCRASGN